MNEEKSPDAEIIASGVFVGYFIYTSVQLIAFMFGTTKHKRELSDTIMNVVGVLLWMGVGGMALHYWTGYLPEHDFANVATERIVSRILYWFLWNVDFIVDNYYLNRWESQWERFVSSVLHFT